MGGDDRAHRRARHGADGEGGGRLPDRADRLGAARHPASGASRRPRRGWRARRSASSARRSCCAPRPGFEPGCLFALLGGALLGTYLAATRGARRRPTRSRRWRCSRCSAPALLAPFALAGGLPALTPGSLSARSRSGAISAACHFLTVAAYQRAEATVLAPFLYFNLADRDGAWASSGSARRWLGRASRAAAIAAGGLVALMRPGRAAQLPADARLARCAVRVTGGAFRA